MIGWSGVRGKKDVIYPYLSLFFESIGTREGQALSPALELQVGGVASPDKVCCDFSSMEKLATPTGDGISGSPAAGRNGADHGLHH